MFNFTIQTLINNKNNHINIMNLLNNNQSKTLWIGDLQLWMDQPYLHSLAKNLGFTNDLAIVRIIKDKVTNQPAKYGFLQFVSHQKAQHFYSTFNGKNIPGTNKVFKMNWAAYSSGAKPLPNTNLLNAKSSLQQYSVYVGDLESHVNQAKLLQFFKQRYPSAFMSKIITDNVTKLPKGYGFVKFMSQQQALKAISEINGTKFEGKTIKVSNAYMKNKDEGTVNNQPVQGEAPAHQIMKLYQEYYSMLNDPLLKAEYERQMLKTFGMQQEGKNIVREKMEKMIALPRDKTQKSKSYLDSLPKRISFNVRRQIESDIFG